MKYVSKFLWLMAAGIMVFGACSKDETFESYSDLGVEQDKQNLENEGLKSINDLRDLSNTSFALAGVEMMKMLSSQPLAPQNRLFGALVGIGDAMGNEKPVDQSFEVLKSVAYNEEGVFSAMWNEGKGVWEWNSVLNDFERVSTEGDEISYKFPSVFGANNNNATIRLYGFKVFTGNFPGYGKDLGAGLVMDEMIQELYFSMQVDDELVATSNIINSFSRDGRFDDIAITFNPLPFSFTAELGRKDNRARWHYKIKNGEKVLLEHLLEMLVTDDLNSDYPWESIDTYFRLNGIEIVGLVDAEKLFPIIDKVEEESESGQILSATEEQDLMEQLAAAINDNAVFKLKYVEGGIIAKVHAVAYFKEVDTMESYWDIGLLLEFSDGSKISMESFFEQSFDRFTDEMEYFMREMEERMTIGI